MSIDTVARPKGAAMAWTGGVLLLLGLVAILGGTAAAPFIYSLF